MKATKFFICPHCGNLVEMVHDAGVTPVCCGQKMDALIPNTVDASGEKHVPMVTLDPGVVTVHVGSVDHPMLDEHFIQWIHLETEQGSQRKYLKPGEAPHAVFHLGSDKPVAVYEYCNLHGLWKVDI